jgi:hypothetical protein
MLACESSGISHLLVRLEDQILPTNDGHPVKRVTYASVVNHDKKKNSNQEDKKTRRQEDATHWLSRKNL